MLFSQQIVVGFMLFALMRVSADTLRVIGPFHPIAGRAIAILDHTRIAMLGLASSRHHSTAGRAVLRPDHTVSFVVWEAYPSMDWTPIYILLGVISFWLVIFVLSLTFFRRSLRVPTESELELAAEHTHTLDASTGAEEGVRTSAVH